MRWGAYACLRGRGLCVKVTDPVGGGVHVQAVDACAGGRRV